MNKIVSITEAKAQLSALVRDAITNDINIIVVNRSHPVAVIINYERYKDLTENDFQVEIIETLNRPTWVRIKRFGVSVVEGFINTDIKDAHVE
ncbi:MAG TPA: type II toxin-antitoxin system Phd/YefM family antitoxin [Gammaproteobacteria bacterium]|nr:type II toxin-antitoxin system Phd/YefM family antitoxin [Gammaproteobacteria bacterium]